MGVCDSMGTGTTAAALGGVALGAFRAKRRVNAQLDATALAIHHTMEEVAVEGAYVNVILGRWHGPSSTFRWITCGHQPPMLVRADGGLLELEGTEHPSLGLGGHARRFTVDRRRLEPGERLLLISDGVLDRCTGAGESFGMAGVRAALAGTRGAAASTVRALEDAITAASIDPLQDDATIVVFAPIDT